MPKELTREQTAERVGYYFGLQRAFNMSRDPALSRALEAEMGDTLLLMPPGTVEAWPSNVLQNETDS